MEKIKDGKNYRPGTDTTTINCPDCGCLNHYNLEELVKQAEDKPYWYTDLNKNKGKQENNCFKCGKELTLYIKAE